VDANSTPGARLAGRLQEVDRAQDVDTGVRRGRIHRSADVDLRRQMADQFRAERGHLVVERGGVGDAHLVQWDLRVQPLGPA